MSQEMVITYTPSEQALIDLFVQHSMAEFVTKDVEAALATMDENPYVLNVPVLTGGTGKEGVRHFYSNHLIPEVPADMETIILSQTVGQNRLVVEGIMRLTHTVMMEGLLPGIAPTGKRIEVAMVAVIEFRNGKVASEHLYWDQASVLAQAGLIDASKLPVKGAESAQKLQELMQPS